MKWRILLLALGLLLFLGVGLLLSFVLKARRVADEEHCKNNLREITLFAAHFSGPQPKEPRKFVDQIPAGTIVLPGIAPEDRLSWFVPILPGLNQKRQDMIPLLQGIDEKQPWKAEPNQAVARTRLLVALCPGNPPPSNASEPALSNYVGIAGLGLDSPTLTLPPAPFSPPAQAGCFRYDAPTPFTAITDGLSQTLLMGERSVELGPWMRGGPATVRGLDNSPGAKLLQGPGGQFGGNHPYGANWAFADGSVRFFTDRIHPQVLFALATIAGKETDTLPGD